MNSESVFSSGQGMAARAADHSTPGVRLARPGYHGAMPGASDDLAAAIAGARAALPGIEVPDDEAARYLAERLTEGPHDPDRAAELYLCCACLRGDRKALALFETRYGRAIDAALGRLTRSKDARDEARQSVLAQLFVAAPGARPKIAEFTGRGELAGWLRVTAVRAALKLRRAGQREVPLEDELLADLAAPAAGSEMEEMKKLYRPAFSAAFREALAGLAPRDQNLLRQHYLDGVAIEGVAALYGVHRATAARWLARAREALFGATKGALMQRTGMTRSECLSVIRLVQSQLEVTLRRLLTPP